MWRVRGRTQLTVIALAIATLILILYRMSANDVAASSITKESRVHLTSMNSVNALSTVTHRSEQIAKQQVYEAQIMADIRGREGYEDDRLGRRLMFPNDNGVLSGGNRADTVKEDSGRSWNSGVHAFKGHKLVHLDLKGAPPRVSYYEEFFPLIRSLGATGILMEYEDMFPFSGPQFQDLPAYNAYSKSDIQHILQLATNNELEIIPLIQAFGHLEFLLKLERYTELREVHKYPQVKYCENMHIIYIHSRKQQTEVLHGVTGHDM
jgi:Glycosyl hydrolase family 20, catalytic domain.